MNGRVGQYLEFGWFAWYKADAGYSWIDNREGIHEVIFEDDTFFAPEKKTNPFLTESPETMHYVAYNPLKHTTLFLEFAELELTKDSILSFVNRYGPLVTQGDASISSPATTLGETFDFWVEEILAMKQIVQLWHAYEKRDSGAVAEFVRWQSDLVYYSFANKQNHVLTINPDTLASFKFGDVLFPALHLIQDITNEYLSKYRTLPRLLFNEKNELGQYLVPENLLAGLWLQFYQAISGERLFKRCAICGLWADVTEKRPTWTRHPECANRNRVQSHRKKQDQLT